MYGTDVLIATGNSFTGSVLKAEYTEKMVGDMIMPNGLSAYSCKMSGAKLKETVRNFVEGYQGGFIRLTVVLCLCSAVFLWRSGKRMMVIH